VKLGFNAATCFIGLISRAASGRTAVDDARLIEMDMRFDQTGTGEAPARIVSFGCARHRAAAGYSPDRVDALVWAFSELLVEQTLGENLFELYRRQAEAAAQRIVRGIYVLTLYRGVPKS
jgi:hypothetical protein